MKSQAFSRCFVWAWFLASVGIATTLQAETITFGDLGLPANAYWNGPDPAGSHQPDPWGGAGPVIVGGFASGGATFNNTYNTNYGNWSGFGYSSMTDATTPGYGNQFSAITGAGRIGSGDAYGVAFGSSSEASFNPSNPAHLQGLPNMTLASGASVLGAYVTNTTYAALSMRDGDGFSKAFGGDSGNDPDWLLLSAYGTDASGTTFLGMAEMYLADFRFADNALDYILDAWEYFDLSAWAGAERVFEVLDEAEEPADAPDAPDLKSPEGGVAFYDVSFSYDKGRPVLDRVRFTVPAGQVCALVGETGSGKTTIVNLLTRFYDPDSGSIFIDGQDILKVTRESLRRVFSVVLQDTNLFTGTIMDNIRYARPGASDEEVVQAAKLARAHGFIERLPLGYKTELSGNADSLSEGQRQLLAIARAVLGEGRILILDEATSSVDTKTEKDIQRAMLGLMKGRTTFLIAHRLSTIRDADQILVLSKGRIVERGDHASLMAEKGHYYEMVVSQMGLEAQVVYGCARGIETL